MRPRRRMSLGTPRTPRTLAGLLALVPLTTTTGFAGILYGGGQPIKNDFMGVVETLDRLDTAASGVKRRYAQEGVAEGVGLAGSLSEQALALRQEILELQGQDLDARAVLEVAIASSTAVDAIASVRQSLGGCGLCNLGAGTFDAVDRALGDFGGETAVLWELLHLTLLPEFSSVLPAPRVPEILPAIVGEPPMGGELPSLAAEVDELLAAYRALGDTRGVELAGAMAAEVQVLGAAVDTAIVEVTQHGLTPQNAIGVLEAFAEIRDALARLEEAVVQAQACCQASPGLLAPVRTLLAHARSQVGALGDAAVDTLGPEILAPAEGAPVLEPAVVAEFLRQAIADGEPVLGALGEVYRHLGIPRGEKLARDVASALRNLPAAIEVFEAKPSAGHLAAVTNALDGMGAALDDIEDCCNAIPGALVPARYALSRVRSHWQRVREVQIGTVIDGPPVNKGELPHQMIAAHWRSTVAELSSLAAWGARHHRALGNKEGGDLAEGLAVHNEEIDIDSYASASDDAARASALGDIASVLSAIDETADQLEICCQLAPPVARLRTTAEVLSREVETVHASLVVDPRFLRGDCNDDLTVDLSDAVFTLGSLFLGDGDPGCDDACDSNDDAGVDISDAINTLGALFLGNGVIPQPGMTECGIDPTDDEVGCMTYSLCP